MGQNIKPTRSIPKLLNNSWLNGFEAQLHQMLDINYDFIHVLMMIYAKQVKKQVDTKNLGLSDKFWAEVTD
jgi:hypothetical protein